MYYPVEARITALTAIRRERLLPVPGQVLVGLGEMVGSADVVARCQLPGDVQVIDVSRALGVPRERAARYLRKAVGEAVHANDLLAARRGPFGQLGKSCRSPVDGVITEIHGSLILIEAAATTLELRAHLKGQVTNVMPNRGAVVSAVGAVIQGFWGCGGEAEGVLKMLVDNPQKPVRAHAVDVSCHGTVVVGGCLLEDKVLEQATEARVRGMIVGGINSDLYPLLSSLSFPVLITEGFGAPGLSKHVFSLLQTNAGREAMISTDTETRWGAKRPEVLIPLRADEEIPRDEPSSQPLRVGDQVRALRAPYLGTMGTVAALPALPKTVESGVRLAIAVVDLEDAQQVQIPLANLERIH